MQTAIHPSMLPIQQELRLPAEFESHRATYLLWPLRPDNWRDGAIHAQKDIAQLANLLAPHEPVTVGFASESSPAAAFEFHPEVSFLKLEYDDIWVRDTGPIVLTRKDRTPVALDFKFNSWGGLFNQSSLDDALAGKIAAVEKIEILRSDLVLEGGAILTDGAGTIFVTEESVLNYNRNPGMKRDDAELVFRKFLNAKQTIWLPRGLAHDESGGHGIACIGYRRSNASEFLTRKGFLIEAGHELSRRNQSGSRARVPAGGGSGLRTGDSQ